MSNKNTKKTIELLNDETISAHESTGALQKVSIDPDEIAKFHKQFNSTPSS